MKEVFAFVLLFATAFAHPANIPLELPYAMYENDGLERALTPEDLDRLMNPHPDDNAEEFSGQIEGDLLISEAEWQAFNGRIDPHLRWPDNRVHYWIDPTFFNTAQMNEIRRAAQYIDDNTCLTFIEHAEFGAVPDFIYVHGNSTGCAALVGRRGGPQRLRLQPANVGSSCFRFGTLVHEFMHAIGFFHMHNTYDRDLSIRINWENVREGATTFDITHINQLSNFGVPYDVGSVVHYSATASSGNGQPTMTAIFNPHGRTMGQRIEATPEDFLRINRMHDCPFFPN